MVFGDISFLQPAWQVNAVVRRRKATRKETLMSEKKAPGKLAHAKGTQKFKTRYATLGFMHNANLDEGALWPTAFALTELTAAEEARIGALVKKAMS